jgi:ArsR family transcriptional regulator, cadmium/lead-responsive transcriptional repressor
MIVANETAGLALRARFFHALAEPSRLVLLEALRGGERTVSELVSESGLSQSNASGHLACLRAYGLVETRQEWRHIHYRLAGPHIAHLLREADLVLEVVAGQVAACEQHGRGGHE